MNMYSMSYLCITYKAVNPVGFVHRGSVHSNLPAANFVTRLESVANQFDTSAENNRC